MENGLHGEPGVVVLCLVVADCILGHEVVLIQPRLMVVLTVPVTPVIIVLVIRRPVQQQLQVFTYR